MEGVLSFSMYKMLPNTFNINVGNRIRYQRENLGYSREKLAELANMSDGYLGEIERGTKGISSFFLYNISVSLGIPMDYFVTSEQDTNNVKQNELQTILNLLHKSKETDLVLIEKIMRAIVITD